MNPLLEYTLSTDIDVSSMSVKSFRVSLTNPPNIKPFVEHWHYSKSITGLRSDYCFQMMHEDQMIGAMIYGRVAMPGAWKRYADREEDLIELRRLCCIDKTPKNTESYFIGKTIKWLKKNTDIKVIVSYADTFHGHEGTIYKASNFRHAGMSPPGKMLNYHGRLYHDKVVRNYQWKDGKKVLDEDGNGVPRKDCQRYRDALESGEAFWVETTGKHIYIYDLK